MKVMGYIIYYTFFIDIKYTQKGIFTKY